MQLTGIVQSDTPDPLVAIRDRVTRLDVKVAGLQRQPHLQDWGALDLREQHATTDSPLHSVTVSRSYTLWRNPCWKEDPRNFIEPEDLGQQPFDHSHPDPQPHWLAKQAKRMRYPLLWNVVQTHWSSSNDLMPSVETLLVEHVRHLLRNQFPSSCSSEVSSPSQEDWSNSGSLNQVQSGYVMNIDDSDCSGFLFDANELVLGMGASLDDGRVLTAAIPRKEASLVHYNFNSDDPIVELDYDI